ncbi:MAG TPA: efflux RND transporter permease subunit [Microbacterium sp.]|nr:efflux RND transporter permease subunit [Microbacterium sp.]
MNLIALSVRRPIGVIMAFVVVLVLGGVAWRELAVDLLPSIDMPRVSVTTAYPGVAPQDIETLLTRPIEQAVSTVDGVESVRSISSEGLSRVELHFAWGMDLDAVVAEVRAQLDRIRASLPEAADPPNVMKFDLSGASVAHLGLAGSGDARRLRYLAEEDLARRLEALPGVAQVDPRGGRRREIRVELSRDRLAALGIGATDVSAALARENRNVSAGTMLEAGQEVVIRTEGEFQTVEALGDTVLAHRGGRPITLRELAVVRDGVQEIRDQLWVDGVPGIRLVIYKQSGANTMAVVETLRAEVEAIERDYAGQLELTILRDSGRFIEESLQGIQAAVLLGGGLAVLVLFAFLRDVRATAIIATAMPVSILATIALMYFSGLTLNLISFGGLALGTGMLVDNAIVILENIYRQREQGLAPREAAVAGASEVASSIVAGTLTTIAAFAPVVFIGGFSGVFFREMAVVVCFSLACSLVVAVTLVPSIAGWAFAASRGAFEVPTFGRGYAGLLARALRRPWTVVGVAVLVLVVSMGAAPKLPSELMPETDEGRLQITVELPAGAPLVRTAEVVREVERRIRQVLTPEELEHVVGVAGPEAWWRPAGSNMGTLDVMLVGAKQRVRTQEQIIAELRRALADLPGVALRIRPDSGNLLLRIMRGGNDDRLSIDILGEDAAAAERLANGLRSRAAQVSGVVYARLDRESGQLERTLVVDRRRLADVGLGAADVALAVEHYVLGRVSTFYREGGEEYDVRVVLREADRARLEQLPSLPIALPSGGTVPLGQLVRIDERMGPTSLARDDQQRIIKIGIGIAGRDLGGVVADLQAILDDTAPPTGLSMRIGGEYREQEKAFSRLLVGVFLAIFLVYAVMAIQFESLRGPLIVMTSIPFALIGVVYALLLTDTSLNVQSALGCVVLIGIVVNNAIVLIDRMTQLREQGLPLEVAVVRGARERLRPVLMTTATTLLGLVPLALGLGEGSELQVPLGRAMLGGLTTSTLVTMVAVPTLYFLAERGRANGAAPSIGTSSERRDVARV